MGDFRVRPRIFHEENFVVPSSTQKIPQCTKEVLEKSKSSNTIKFETIFGKINQIIAKTKSGKWHTFQQEQKLNEKRARNCHFFFTENDGKITFHKGSTSPPKNPVNWTGLLPLGILGLAKLISGAEAVQLNYTTTDPVLMNTPNGEGQFRSCDLALRPDTMGVVWDNNNEISQSWMPYDGSPSTEAPVTTKVGIKEGEVRAVPYKDKTYYFWIHTDANGRSVTYIRVDSNYQVIEEEKSIPMPNNPRHYDCMISLQNGTFHGYLVNRTGHQKWEAYKFQINPETGNRVGSFDKVQEYGTFQQKPTGLFFEDESIATFLTIDGGLYREYQGNFTQICPPPAYPLKYQYAKPCLIPNGYVVGCAIVDTQSLNQIIGYKILRFNPDGSPMDPYEISLASAADMGTTNMFGSTLEILGNARGATVIYRDNGQLKQVTLNETGIPQGEPKPFGTGSNIIAFSAKQSFNTNSTNDDIYSCFTTPTGVSIQRSQTYVPPLPTPAPTPSPSPSPTPFPTQSPTPSPSPSPTPQPTPLPTSSPTPFPTQFPTPSPSPSPTPQPTPLPTSSPTPLPTQSPTPSPTPEPPDPVGPIPDPDSQESIYQKPLFLIPLIAAASLCYCICYCAFCILNRRRKKQKVEAYVDNLAKRDPPLDGSLEYYQASETKDSQRVQLFKFPEPSAPQEEKTKTKKTKSFVEIDVNEEEQPPSRSPPSPPREEKKKSEPNWWKEKKASFGEGMPPKQTPVYTTKSLDEIVVEEKEEEKIPKFVKNIGNWGSFYSEKSLSESEKSWSKSEKSWSKSEEFNELKKDLKKEKRPASDSSDDEMLHRAISKENQLSFSELDDTGSLSTLKKKILDTAPSIATLELFFETQPEEFFTAFQILRDQGYDEKNLPSDPALKEISLKIKQLKKIASSRTDRPSFVDIQKRFSEIATLKRGLSEESRQSFSDVDTLINKIETFERTLQPTESYGDVFDPNRQESEFPTPQESKEELIEDEPEKQMPVDTHHESKLTRRTPSTLGYPSDEEQNGESRFDVETNREGSITTAVLVVKGKSKKTRGK